MAASHMDGLVLSLTPFHNSCNYRSAVAYGYATLVTDDAERLYAMRRITDNMLPQRWDRSRNHRYRNGLTGPTQAANRRHAIIY